MTVFSKKNVIRFRNGFHVSYYRSSILTYTPLAVSKPMAWQGEMLFGIRNFGPGLMAKRQMKRVIAILFLIMGWTGGRAYAQDIAVKTNLLYWASSTPNLSFEFGLGERTSLDLTGGYNPWMLDKETNKKLRHWMVMPEFRYWLCERFNGHFFGVHSGYAFYNISGIRIPFQNKSTKNHRYQGWATGLGVSYGYNWILGRRWNLEATLGFGYVYTNYDKYNCATCGKFKGNRDKHYFGPTKAGISIIYMIK